jgi:CheY-like chemotaxis protein
VGDSGRLRQIIINLVGNAIKFTETGEVIVKVDCESQHNGDVTLHFAISDTGIGIPAKKQETIFQAFEQADTSSTRRFGGTGLGLAICSQLIELMGGQICVDSKPGEGSTFHFTALFGVASDKLSVPLPLDFARLRGVRVLIVDDNVTYRRILEELLSKWEMIPSCAVGAGEALAMVQQALADGEPYRLVLTDSQMPGTDGFGLAEQLRRDQKFNSAIIMMLTSGDRLGDIERCKSLGIELYIRKPAKQSELFEALSGTILQQVQTIESQKPGFAERIRRFGPLRVLLAEDSVLNQKLIVRLLEKHGCTVKVAHNGREALVALDSEPFDIVLMDVQMPEMDGLEATKEIRCREGLTGRHIPIIALTANAMKGDRDRCLDAGMDEYVPKPVRVEQLFDTIALVLQGTSPTSKVEASGGADSMVVDWEEALRSVNGNRVALRNLVEAVLEEGARMLAAVQRAVRSRDEQNLVLVANTLKDAVRYFGAKRLFDNVFQLERMGRDGRLDGVEEIATAVSTDMQRLFQELREYVQSQVA